MMSCALKLMMAVALLSSFVQAQSASNNALPSVADAEKFIQQTEQRLSDLSVKQSQAHWVQETYITDDTEAIAATADENSLKTISELAAEAKKYEGLKLPPEQARKLKLLKLSATAPAPSDPKERTELAKLGTWLDGTYGKGKYCPNSGPFAGKCLGQSEMERAMATTKDPAVLLDLWVGWHAIAPPMRDRYTRFVELANKGAREMGFADMGALWRSNYDMPPDQFRAEIERLWQQVRPLYVSLHAYVRSQLVKKYGPQAIRGLAKQRSFPETLGQRLETQRSEERFSISNHAQIVHVLCLQNRGQVNSTTLSGNVQQIVDVRPVLCPDVAEQVSRNRTLGRNRLWSVFLHQLGSHVSMQRNV